MHNSIIGVIGSNSFSGSSFVRYLIEKGYNVIGFSRSPEPNPVFLPYKWIKNPKGAFKFYQIDLNHQINELIEIISHSKIKYIVNFASLGMVAQSWEKPEDWYKTNVLSQVHFHEKLRKLNIPMIIISTEQNPVVSMRADKLKLPVKHGVKNKKIELEEFANSVNLKLKNIAFVGNDINDIECMKEVGFPIAVLDAVDDVKSNSKLILN